MNPPLLTRAAVVAAGVVAAGTVGLMLSGRAPTTYAAVSPAAAVVTVLAGILLVVAGGVHARTSAVAGLSVLSLGLVWWAPVWVGWEEGPPLARSLAMVAVPFGPVLLLHLSASLPAGTIRSPLLRRAVATVLVVTVAFTAGRATVRDPFLDRYCWNNCSDNVLLVSAQPGLARGLDATWAAIGALVGLAAVVVCARRLVGSSRVGRRHRAPLLLPLAVAGLGLAVHEALLLTRPPEDPRDAAYLATYLATGLSLAALGAGLTWITVDGATRRRALTRLTTDDVAGGDLAGTLAAALGDPTVQVGYWLPDGLLVDRDGRGVEPVDGASHIDVVRGRERVARVWFDPGVEDGAALASRVGSAAVLAVDNERLRAQMLAQVALLRESRSRLVAAADKARRRLERDLHDGAQQRLLALVLDLRVAESRASAAGDLERARRLHAAGEQAQAVVRELRSLAHGIYPAVLDQAGLDGALRAMAESAPLPVAVEPMPVPDSVPLAASRVLYLAAREALDSAARDGATQVRLHVTTRPGQVALEATPPVTPSTALQDRVGAEGGSIGHPDGMLRVEVPCE